MENNTAAVSKSVFLDAVNRIWGFNFSEAEKYFKNESETNAVHSYYYAEALTLRALLTEDSDDVKEAIKRLEIAEKLLSNGHLSSNFITDVFRKLSTSEKTRKNEDRLTVETRLLHNTLLAELSALLGCLHIRKGNYIKGGLYIRTSWKSFESLAKKTNLLHADIGTNTIVNKDTSNGGAASDDSDIDAIVAHRHSVLLFGAGAFYYFVSLVPSSFAWLIEALGFRANRQVGLKLLTTCYEKQGPRAMMALVLVLWINIFFFEDKPKSAELIEVALKRYVYVIGRDIIARLVGLTTVRSDGTPFYYLGGYFARKQRDTTLAINHFQRVNELTADVRKFQLTSYYEIGWCHWLASDWTSAIDWFEKFLAEHKSPSFKAYCGYQLGIAYDMLGKVDKARAAFAPVPGWVRKHYTWDQFAARKAKEYFKNNGMSQYERFIVRAQIIAKLNPKEALKLLKQAKKTGEVNNDLKAVYYYIQGLAYKALKDVPRATKALERGIALEPHAKKEVYAIPHCLTEYAEILFEQGRVEEAKKLFVKARKGFSNYDFDKPLIRKIEMNLDRIKQLMKQEKRQLKSNKATSKSKIESKAEEGPNSLRRVKSFSATGSSVEDDSDSMLGNEDNKGDIDSARE